MKSKIPYTKLAYAVFNQAIKDLTIESNKCTSEMKTAYYFLKNRYNSTIYSFITNYETESTCEKIKELLLQFEDKWQEQIILQTEKKFYKERRRLLLLNKKKKSKIIL